MNAALPIIHELTLYDYIGIGFLIIGWPIYDHLADSRKLDIPDFTRAAMKFRHEWMHRAVRRDPRIADTQIIAILTRNVGFFASTTVLILAGMVTLLGAGERAHSVTYSLPFVTQTSLALWQAKMLIVTALFAYAFFTLTWSLRQWNYCAIVLAAAPFSEDEEILDDYGDRAARLANLAGGHFNKALRAYYYALALIAWFVDPMLFISATALVLWVQFRRDFRSNTFKVLDAARKAPDARSPNGP